MIRFTCPGCGASLIVKREMSGRSGRCPKCAGPVRVPGINTSKSTEPVIISLAGQEQPEEPRPAERKPLTPLSRRKGEAQNEPPPEQDESGDKKKLTPLSRQRGASEGLALPRDERDQSPKPKPPQRDVEDEGNNRNVFIVAGVVFLLALGGAVYLAMRGQPDFKPLTEPGPIVNKKDAPNQQPVVGDGREPVRTAIGDADPAIVVQAPLRKPRYPGPTAHDIVALVNDLALVRDQQGSPKVFDTRTSTFTYVLPFKVSPLQTLSTIASAPHGKLGAAGGHRGAVVTYDLALGRPKQVFMRHPEEPIVSIAFSHDGRRIASVNADVRRAGGDSRVFVWDPETSIADHKLAAPPNTVFLQAVLLPGEPVKVVLVRGQPQAVRPQKIDVLLWNPAAGSETVLLKELDANPATTTPERMAGVSADGKRLAVRGRERTVVIDLESGQPEREIAVPQSNSNCFAVSNDGKLAIRMVQGRKGSFLSLLDLDAGTELARYRPNQQPQRASFLPESNGILTIDQNGEFALWDIPGRPVPGEGWPDPNDPKKADPTAAKETLIAKQGPKAPIREPARTILRGEPVATVASVPGKLLVADARCFEVLDFADGKPLRALDIQGAAAFPVSASTDGKRVVAGARDGSIRGWSLEPDGGRLFFFKEHDAQPKSLELSPDGRFGVSCSYATKAKKRPGRIVVFDAISGRVVKSLDDTGATETRRAIFLKDGRRVLLNRAQDSSGKSGSLTVWDPDTGEERPFAPRIFEGYADDLDALRLSPDGALVVAKADSRFRVFDSETGRLVRSIRIEPNCTYAMDLSPNGKLGVTCGGAIAGRYIDCFAIVFELATGKEVCRFETPDDPVRGARFTADNKYLVTWGEGASLKVWDLPQQHQ